MGSWIEDEEDNNRANRSFVLNMFTDVNGNRRVYFSVLVVN